MGKQGNEKENPFQKVILATGENRTWDQTMFPAPSARAPSQLLTGSQLLLQASPPRLRGIIGEQGKKRGLQLPARCQINRNHAQLNRSAQRLHLPLLENMSHTLTTLRLHCQPLCYFYVPLDRKQDTLPRSPPSSQTCSGEHPRHHNTSSCIFSCCGFGLCSWATANVYQRLWLAQQGIFWRVQGQRQGYFYCDLLGAHLELSGLVWGTLQPTLRHTAMQQEQHPQSYSPT